MVLLDVFREGDVYLDFPYEDVKFRFEKATGKYYRRFYRQAEDEVPFDSALLHEAISAGRQITREEYLSDAEATPPPAAAAESTAAVLPSGAEELLGKPASELEAELRRLASSCRLPPSAVRQLFQSYALQSRLAEEGQRESQQRSFLINAIIAYRAPELRLRAGEERPASELMEIALTMPMTDGPTAEERRAILDGL